MEQSQPRLTDTRLKITSGSMHGKDTRVYLNDIDISYMLTEVETEFGINDVNRVKLSLLVGHIDIDVPIGRLDLNAKGIAIHAESKIVTWFKRAKAWIRHNLTSPNVIETSAFGDVYKKFIPRK